jgi:hypothetical protein
MGDAGFASDTITPGIRVIRTVYLFCALLQADVPGREGVDIRLGPVGHVLHIVGVPPDRQQSVRPCATSILFLHNRLISADRNEAQLDQNHLALRVTSNPARPCELIIFPIISHIHFEVLRSHVSDISPAGRIWSQIFIKNGGRKIHLLSLIESWERGAKTYKPLSTRGSSCPLVFSHLLQTPRGPSIKLRSRSKKVLLLHCFERGDDA